MFFWPIIKTAQRYLEKYISWLDSKKLLAHRKKSFALLLCKNITPWERHQDDFVVLHRQSKVETKVINFRCSLNKTPKRHLTFNLFFELKNKTTKTRQQKIQNHLRCILWKNDTKRLGLYFLLLLQPSDFNWEFLHRKDNWRFCDSLHWPHVTNSQNKSQMS